MKQNNQITRTDSFLYFKDGLVFKTFTTPKATEEELTGFVRMDKIANPKPVIIKLKKAFKPFAPLKENYMSKVIVMRDLGRENSVENLLTHNKYPLKNLKVLTAYLIDFYKRSLISPCTDEDILLRKLEKDINLMRPMFETHLELKTALQMLVDLTIKNTKLLKNRVNSNKVGNIHGDMDLGHIFFVNEQHYLIDFQFSKYRINDVARDIAGLILHFIELKKTNYIKTLMNSYIEMSGDKDVAELVKIQLLKKNLLKAFIYRGGFSNAHTDQEKEKLALQTNKVIREIEI